MPGGSNQLIFPIDSFENVIEDAGTVNILLIHHPLNWYSQTTYHNLRQRVLANYQILMSGHEHQGGVNLVADTHNHCCVMLEAPALDATKSNAFSVTHLDLQDMTLATEVFKWEDNYYAHEAGMPSWDNKQPIAKIGPRNGFHFTEETKAMLESMEASFQHPTKENLCLSDVFVYPEIQDFDSEEENPKEVSASTLLADVEKNRKVLIYGEEQFGKTSLLKRLCIELQLAGKMPIMIEAADASGSSEQFRKILNRRIADFYGEDASGRYAQSALADKVVLVDDLDSVTNRGDVIARVISNLEEQFGRIIMTAGERFEMTVIQFKEASVALEKYSSYRMLGFGYKLRYQLIRNWYVMTAESSTALQELVFNAEQIITAVLGKGLVPMTAFHTLVLLQTIEFNDKQALANSGMAEYYEYMLRQSLLSAKVRREELDEMQNFLTMLAWEMYNKRKKDISFEELAEFNTRYAEQYHRLDIEDRVRLLVSAKILIKTSGTYTFAYSYIGYFFVARYLARTWSEDKGSENHIKYLCSHLYLKENANILLFVTYSLSAEWVIAEVAGVLNQILENYDTLSLSNDVGLLNSWISDKAKLVVDTTDMVANNHAVKESDDSAQKHLPEPVQENEVSSISELDHLAQINLLFKTSEILGQILKGRYGSIRNDMKEDLMKRLFDAPLRAVRFFNEIIHDDPEGLLRELSNRMMKHAAVQDPDKARRRAEKFLYRLMGGIANSFFTRQGEIIGSAKLVDTIDKVANSTGEVTYRVVGAAARLSIPNNAPIEQIKSIVETLDKNYFGYHLLQGLVARHLYMFELSAPLRNRLASAVGISIQDQRNIDYRSQGAKKLPGVIAKPRHAKTLIARLTESFAASNPLVKDVVERYKRKRSKD